MAVTNIFTSFPLTENSQTVAGDVGSFGFFTTLTLTLTGTPSAQGPDARVIAVTASGLPNNVFVVSWQVQAANALVVLLYNQSGDVIDPASTNFEIIWA